MEEFDMRASREMAAQVTEQQLVLQQAGVPGFFPTTNEEHIAAQAKVLELIRSLQQQFGAAR